jgi:hypothetical protein
MGGPGPLGFGWPSLCNRVAQTWGSVPRSTQEQIPTMMAAWVAAALGQRLNTNREWRAFAHTLMLGEHKANVNSLRALRFFWRSGKPLRRSSGGQYPASYEGLRQQILRRNGCRCQSCGTMSNLEVHHREFRQPFGSRLGGQLDHAVHDMPLQSASPLGWGAVFSHRSRYSLSVSRTPSLPRPKSRSRNLLVRYASASRMAPWIVRLWYLRLRVWTRAARDAGFGPKQRTDFGMPLDMWAT